MEWCYRDCALSSLSEIPWFLQRLPSWPIHSGSLCVDTTSSVIGANVCLVRLDGKLGCGVLGPLIWAANQRNHLLLPVRCWQIHHPMTVSLGEETNTELKDITEEAQGLGLSVRSVVYDSPHPSISMGLFHVPLQGDSSALSDNEASAELN